MNFSSSCSNYPAALASEGPPSGSWEAVQHVTENEMLRQQRGSQLERRGEGIHAARLLIRDAQPSWRGQAGAESKKLPKF